MQLSPDRLAKRRWDRGQLVKTACAKDFVQDLLAVATLSRGNGIAAEEDLQSHPSAFHRATQNPPQDYRVFPSQDRAIESPACCVADGFVPDRG
jgi:hypothetical protein